MRGPFINFELIFLFFSFLLISKNNLIKMWILEFSITQVALKSPKILKQIIYILYLQNDLTKIESALFIGQYCFSFCEILVLLVVDTCKKIYIFPSSSANFFLLVSNTYTSYYYYYYRKKENPTVNKLIYLYVRRRIQFIFN